MVYLEALADLSPAQIDRGCQEAIKSAEQFPKPGHIRAAIPIDRSTFLGPPMLTYPEISEEEREEALKFSEQLRENLGPTPPCEKKKQIPVQPSKLTLSEQKEILRRKGYLK